MIDANQPILSSSKPPSGEEDARRDRTDLMESSLVPKLLQEHLAPLLLLPSTLLGPLHVLPLPLAFVHRPSTLDLVLFGFAFGLGESVAVETGELSETPGFKVGGGFGGVIDVGDVDDVVSCFLYISGDWRRIRRESLISGESEAQGAKR
jgi:hypothetical protein